VPAETNEVHIHLHGGDDRAVVTGAARAGAVRLRVVGGAGDDLFADSSGAHGAPVTFHDDSGANRVQGGAGPPDTRHFTPPGDEDPLSSARYRDFGSSAGVAPLVGYESVLGLVAGGGATWTRYGFRRVPYARKVAVHAAYAPRLAAAGVELEADWRGSASPLGASLLARATQLEPFFYFGLGNDSPAPGDRDPFLVERDLLRVEPALDVHLSPRSRISVGPVARYARLRPREGSLARGARRGTAGELGGRADALLDLRDEPAMPRRGALASLGGALYPVAWDGAAPFGELHAAASTYLSLPGRGPTLALRGGARRVWGGFPEHEAAFVGGWSTLRGYETHRFAGDAALWGGAELRSFLTRLKLVVRGDLGALAFADAGRVYLDGASPGGWHGGAGGGLSFLFRLDQTPVSATAVYARGETGKIRLQLGAPF